ncbi:MAG: [FeFe] hydrogenase H-cluster radical SAM maturase HydG [Parcubacteria group bacterium]|nr:[FeFe] hydrogenase H-cluster radical SAM maturase HydG [Parcubacteria group bacterium]MCR4342942.1 [FeFe] hydrogenase H-cluster radical SAM maturase HydG [Patescibacteria group bacterium]
MTKVTEIINEKKILNLLKTVLEPEKNTVLKILKKASKKKGLNLKDVACLLNTKDKKLVTEMHKTAGQIKQDIYGERLVLFAPLYISSFCINDCEYCGFHRRNTDERKKLSTKEIEQEVKVLLDMGHKRLLLEFGEHPLNKIEDVVNAIDTIYKTKSKNGEIRRVNVNIAATSVEDYKKLKKIGIGTYQLFQETYHRETYDKMHDGPKANYERQLFAHDKAFEAGIDDVGLGVLFGLYNYKFEVLSLLSHAKYLDKKYGVGPHTFSVPRFQPAPTVKMKTPYKVNNDDFLKIIAILRMAVPYTGIIISTRETPEIRSKAFEIGISQASSGSITTPGGYSEKENRLKQFELGDHRDINQFLISAIRQDLLPSFCTACYRKKRTGKAFMDLAKPGDIQNFCRPNAILTFKEYLEDYAQSEVRTEGEKLMVRYLEQIPNENIKKETKKRLKAIEQGKRDLYF